MMSDLSSSVSCCYLPLDEYDLEFQDLDMWRNGLTNKPPHRSI